MSNIFSFLFLNVDGFSWSLLVMFISMGILLLGSALVSGSEIAFFSLSPSLLRDLEEEQSTISESVLILLRSPRTLLATLLISNNFINVAIILLSSIITMDLFHPTDIEIYSVVLKSGMILFLINVVLVTFLILLIGEVIPKVYATTHPIELLRVTVMPIRFINTVLTGLGITTLLVKSTNFFEKEGRDRAQNVTVDDLQHALDLTSRQELERDDHKILEGVVKFGNTDVKQIMTPRVKAAFIEINTPFGEVIDIIKETHYSRIPIFEDSIDVIKGVLYAKDLLPHLENKEMEWQKLIRKPFFVPENKKIDNLLVEFQSLKTHIALVVDEYGGVSGLVTLEDVIEEIVGDISDEFDDEDLYYSKLADNVFVFEGQTSLNNMYRALSVKGDDFEGEKGEADSVAGFVLEIAGRIPQKGESIKFKNYSFTIESADRRRIKSIKVTINPILDED